MIEHTSSICKTKTNKSSPGADHFWIEKLKLYIICRLFTACSCLFKPSSLLWAQVPDFSIQENRPPCSGPYGTPPTWGCLQGHSRFLMLLSWGFSPQLSLSLPPSRTSLPDTHTSVWSYISLCFAGFLLILLSHSIHSFFFNKDGVSL